MKIKQYHYIILFILIIAIGYKIKETFLSRMPITRSFTGSRNHFVGMGYPDWGDGFK